jgi:glutamine phosphoribosylpyrophosphate amidotransferase
MCGIIGYIGENKVTPILLDGLRKLEYRGYMEEIVLARQLKDYKAAKFILDEMYARRKEIIREGYEND